MQAALPRRGDIVTVENPPWEGLRRPLGKSPTSAAATPAPQDTPPVRQPKSLSRPKDPVSLVRRASERNPQNHEQRTQRQFKQVASPAKLVGQGASNLKRSVQTLSSWLQQDHSQTLVYGEADKQVKAILQKDRRPDLLQELQADWLRFKNAPKNIEAPRRLANIYAQAMHARRLTAFNTQLFAVCIDIGLRALQFDITCCAAYEQLAIAYSIVQVAPEQAKTYLDKAIAYGGLGKLAAGPASTTMPSFQPSADFYFAYWKTFRNDPSREQQTTFALQAYRASPAHNRFFDEILSSQLLIMKMMDPG